MTLALKRLHYAGIEHYSNRAFPDVRCYVRSSVILLTRLVTISSQKLRNSDNIIILLNYVHQMTRCDHTHPAHPLLYLT